MLPDRRRRPREIRRPDGFVGLLRVLRLGGIESRLLREVALAELPADRLAGALDCFRSHLHAVGAHIGDQADRLAADVETLVEALRHLHGAHRREAELRGRRLLQRRGREGRAGAAPGRLCLHGQRPEAGAFQHGADAVGLILRGNVELLQALALEASKARLEAGAARRPEHGRDLPVLLADEPLDLELAVADQPERHRLHAAGRAGARQLSPEHRRQREADQVVERAARQIGIDERRVDLPRIGHRLGDRLFGDGIEDHPTHRLVLQHALLAEHFQHVPGNRLAFAVGVGGEDEAVGVLHGAGDLGQPLRGRPVHGPGHGEILVRPDRAVLGGQVADMPEGGQDPVVAAQIFVDRFRLRRRFDDDDIHVVYGSHAAPGGRPSQKGSSVTWPRFAVGSSAGAGKFAAGGGPARSRP